MVQRGEYRRDAGHGPDRVGKKNREEKREMVNKYRRINTMLASDFRFL